MDMLDVQEEKMKKWKYAIDSMTPWEKENPEEIKQSRVKRIARGAGIHESDVRQLLKYYKQTKKMMKLAKVEKVSSVDRLQSLPNSSDWVFR
jgi:signal recognition particle subunit SRP54